MSKVRIYIKPFENSTSFQEDWIDVTNDISTADMGTLTAQLEGSDYDVGVFSFSNISIKLDNSSGKYTEANDIRSIFRFRRNGSKVKITWQKGDTDAICGFAICGEEYPYYELEVFQGVLDDQSASSDLETSQISFSVLSLGYILSTFETPFASLSDGDTCKEILETLLAETTLYLDVDNDNINPKNDVAIDDVSNYENTSIKDVLATVLKISNSVLYFEGNTVFVKSREETANLKQTFYGQASKLGIEDVQSISKIKSGYSRTFNLWKWKDTSLVAKNTTSIDLYGLKKKEVDYSEITNSTTQQSILDDYVDEFGIPKREFDLSTHLDVGNRSLLDKVNIDYPTPYYTREESELPIYGKAIYGTAIYPYGEYGLTLSTDEYFKIIAIKIDLKNDLITYGLREI